MNRLDRKVITMSTLTLIALLGFSGSAASQNFIAKKCQVEIDGTNSALSMRDRGITKIEFEATLPPREQTANDQRFVLLHTVIDDIYERPDIAGYPYFQYRMLMCATRGLGMEIRVPLEKIADDLVACQNEYGTKESKPLRKCIRDAMAKNS